MKTDWYKDWFNTPEYLNVYRHRNDDDSERIIGLLLLNIEIDSKAKILDAACGAGRHSINFAEKGYDVHGFDLSETLLKIARKEASEKDLDIHFSNADKRYFKTDEKFGLIVSLFTSFGYFYSDEENFAFPRNAFNMLKKNGYYVLDYLNKSYIEESLVKFSRKNIKDKEIIESREISEGRVIKKIEIRKNGEKKEFIESVKLYSYDEIKEKFQGIGYTVFKVFGNYSGSIFDHLTSERCIIIFKK